MLLHTVFHFFSKKGPRLVRGTNGRKGTQIAAVIHKDLDPSHQQRGEL